MTASRLSGNRTSAWACLRYSASLAALLAALVMTASAGGKESAKRKPKHVIGATASVTEIGSGIQFRARVDTGAETCSLHVERIEIQDKSARRSQNIGKTIRFKLKGNDGEFHWLEGIIADAVRVKSSLLPSGDYDHRYKVRLTLQWKDVQKEVLVTLNNRTDMEYPLLVGRNFLRGDFLVDVSQTGDEG